MIKNFKVGLSSGKYRNPFISIGLKDRLIIVEIWLLASQFFFKKTFSSENFYHSIRYNISLTIYKRIDA